MSVYINIDININININIIINIIINYIIININIINININCLFRPESIFLEKEETSFFRALSLIPCNTEHKEVKVVNLTKICPTIQELQQSFVRVKELCVMETSKEFWSIDPTWLTSLETSK